MFQSQLPLTQPYWQIIAINFYKDNNNIFFESLEEITQKTYSIILVGNR